MQDRKQYILDKAFEVFMAKGYDSASMTVLQQELKMSRGAMYRHFESKDELFKAVIDEYVFGLLEYLKPDLDNDMPLDERINQVHQHLKERCACFDEIEGINVKFLNFTALIIQAAKRYPGFLDKVKEYRKTAMTSWERSIRKSIEMGKVREDVNINIMANVFFKSFNLIETNSTPDRNFTRALDAAHKMMKYIYSLIKV